MIGIEFEKSIVALACWREMRGEGVNAMLAVAFVLRNRAKSGWHNGSIYQNAIKLNQISSMSVLGDRNTIKYPDVRDPDFQTLLHKLDAIYDDAPDMITSGARYYAVLTDATSGWFFENIVADTVNHPRVAVIGKTTLFL